MQPSEVFGRLRDSVTGIDVHPVAVHLARATYVLAARTAIRDAAYTSITVPIYLGDALQLRFRSGDLFAQHEITIQVNDEENTELSFPVSLVERPENFDALMGDIADYIERGDNAFLALDDNRIDDAEEREMLEQDNRHTPTASLRGARSYMGILCAQYGASNVPYPAHGWM